MQSIHPVQRLFILTMAVTSLLQLVCPMDLERFKSLGSGTEDNEECEDEMCNPWRVGDSLIKKRGTNCAVITDEKQKKVCRIFLGKRKKDTTLLERSAVNTGESKSQDQAFCNPDTPLCRFKTGGKKQLVAENVSNGLTVNAVKRRVVSSQDKACPPNEIHCRGGKRTVPSLNEKEYCKDLKSNSCRWRGKKDEIKVSDEETSHL